MNTERICYGCFGEKDPGSVCPHCGFLEYQDQPYLALPLGAILNGRYMVGKVLGIGGFGITYLGFDLTLEIKVAIKEYMPSGLATRHSDQYTVQLTSRSEDDYRYGMDRFLEEARVLAKLQNTANIVSVQNYFKENNTAYFVMEYIEGMSLKEYLSAHGEKIEVNQALSILQPIMVALSQVHALNLLHRDISPDNIYITDKGESRLLDFGAARFALGDGKSVSIILKHGYAPEEQYSSRGNQGPWTDVYAMGATLYRSITGILPPDSLGRIHDETIKKPSELGVQLPARVEKAILTALAVNPKDRFPNMESFIEALGERPSVIQSASKGIKKTSVLSEHQNEPKNRFKSKTFAFSDIRSKVREKPFMAGLIGGGILLALLIILPLLLSKGASRRGDSSNGSTTNTTITIPVITDTVTNTTMPVTSPNTLPVTSPTEQIEQDLGYLNATINIPSNYQKSGDVAWIFTDHDKAREILIQHYWRYGVPIYSLLDIEANLEIVVDTFMSKDYSDHIIIASGPYQKGIQEGYQIQVQGTGQDGVSKRVLIRALSSQAPFGSYMIITEHPESDSSGEEDLLQIIDTFQVQGPVETNFITESFANSGVKFIVDGSLVQGGIMEMPYNLADGTPHSYIRIYPTENNKIAGLNPDNLNAGGIEVVVSDGTPEEILKNYKDISAYEPSGESYAFRSNVYVWLIQDYSYQAYKFKHASTQMDGKSYEVFIMFDDAIETQTLTLWDQMLSSLRPF